MTQRVFHGQRIWRLTQDGFDRATELLAAAVAPTVPELVIGIERGGRRPAEALGDLLDVPHILVTARHNLSDAQSSPATGDVRLDLSALAERDVKVGRRLLVVDDICGSGATLAAIGERLRARGETRMRSATLCRNVGAALHPTWWLWEVADWVTFPWEPLPAAETTPLPTPTHVRSLP